MLVPRAGHFVMFEQAARVNQEILGFVAALPVARVFAEHLKIDLPAGTPRDAGSVAWPAQDLLAAGATAPLRLAVVSGRSPGDSATLRLEPEFVLRLETALPLTELVNDNGTSPLEPEGPPIYLTLAAQALTRSRLTFHAPNGCGRVTADKPCERPLALFAGLRGAAEERFRDEEIACYQRFLVNRCIEQARARRVADVRKAREMDNEAGRIELAEKNRRFEERQADAAREAPAKAVERAEQEARNRADSESRLRQFSEKDAARVKREQDGKSQAMEAAADRNRKDAADARRRATEARAAASRAEQATSDRADYEARARKAAEKKAEKARKAASGSKSSGADATPLLGK